MSRKLLLVLLFVLQGAPTQNAGQAQGGRGGAATAQNPNSVSPVEFVIDPPTLINLGFEWFIQGDDNRDATETLARVLELSGHEVHTAHDGLEAVEAAAKLQPGAVLLDIRLPGLVG